MYKNEIEMYPDIIKWLKSFLRGKFGSKAKKISVIDTHDSDLSNFIIKFSYQKYFPEYSTYKIRQDITGFIEFENSIELIFVECKNKSLSLIHLSQLIGYSCIALPISSILISPQGMSDSLYQLLITFNRKDVLKFHTKLNFAICKWDEEKQDIDYSKSLI